MDADDVEIRVLGCLIEKQRTTPDVYPLSLNSLRAACNQSTNRDPIVAYDEPTIRAALDRLGRKGWARLASGAGSRAVKYRHLLDETFGLADAEMALLPVLMLRGPQTPGELKQRGERLHRFTSLDEIERALAALVERKLAARLPRRPGQKEQRYTQLLGGNEVLEAGTPLQSATAASPSRDEPLAPAQGAQAADARVVALEARLERVEDEVSLIREALESLREDRGA